MHYTRSRTHTHIFTHIINLHRNDLETVNMTTYCETASHRHFCQLHWEQIKENSKRRGGGKKRKQKETYRQSVQPSERWNRGLSWACGKSWVYTGIAYLTIPEPPPHTHTHAQPTPSPWFNDSTDTYAIVLPLIMGRLEELVLTAQACIFKTIMCNQTQCSC